MSGTSGKRSAAVTPAGVNHLVLNVHNMEESHHFWCDLLGFKHVGTLKGKDGAPASMNMRFYSGVVDDVNHHDLALCEREGLAAPETWNMMSGRGAINHIAITYPDRESWLAQLQFLDEQGVEMGLRLDHGMTHSMYISDPNGYGVEVLYDLPEEVWRHDIDGALSYAEFHPRDHLTDTTEYETDFSARTVLLRKVDRYQQMSILGNRVVRTEDPAFLTTGGSYVDGLEIANAAHVVYVRSLMAHAKITGLDVSEARIAPGVVAVFTADDIAEVGLAPNVLPMFPDEMKRPFLAGDIVRHVGQPIVAVVAETLAQATDATELVYVDYEPLPVVLDLEESASGDTLLFPEFGSNIVNTMHSEQQADFDECEVVVEERIMNQRLTAGPIEPRAGAAWWTDDGRLVHYSACQGAHPTRDLLARIFELEPGQVRVVVPDVGGGFGAKSRTYPEELILGFYARAIGRPVRWTETRTENVMAMPQGRGQLQFAKLGGTRDGRITAYQLDVFQDCGAHPLISAVLAGMTRRMLTGTYDITNVGFKGTSVVTNMVSTTAYRGAGRPEATVAIERMIDRFADEIGMDPAEVRFRNLVPRFTEPYTTGIGTVYDVGDYPQALRLAMDAVDYESQLAEQAGRRERGDNKMLGIGIGSYVEVTAGGPGGEFGSVELRPDGRVRVVSGSTPFGQGHETTWAMIVADRTGIPMHLIDVVHGDTDLVERGGLTVGSRSVQLGGSAVAAATTQLIERARERAAAQLEAAAADVVLDVDSGAFHVTGTPAVTVAWHQIAAELDRGLLEFHDFTVEMPTFPCGAHIAVVEVDRETGETTVLRMVAADDAGTLLNPLLAEGQVHGGLAQGIAEVLYEAIEYDEDGNLLTSNFMDYLIVSPTELPSFEVVHLETPTWVNELGAKGVGESGTIGAIPAVYNAVIDALSHLGVRHMELPLTPQKVWSAITA